MRGCGTLPSVSHPSRLGEHGVVIDETQKTLAAGKKGEGRVVPPLPLWKMISQLEVEADNYLPHSSTWIVGC